MTLTIAGGESITIGPTDSQTIQRELIVSGELTVQGNLVVNNVRELLATGSDGDVATTPLTRLRSLQTPATDTDSATVTTTRVRSLIAGRTLTVPPTTTTIISTDQTEHSATVEGELTVTAQLTLNGIAQPAADADVSPAQLSRKRALATTAADADSAISIATRLRLLQVGVAGDSDTAQAAAQRSRGLLARANDVDAATTVFLPISNRSDSRAAVIELLDNFGSWPGTRPEIKPIEATTPKTRENTRTPTIYAHKPTADTIDRFSSEGLEYTEGETVELYIYILETNDETPPRRAAREYRNRVINALSAYLNDNYTRTEFLSIEPVGATDRRGQTTTRQTDHVVYTVEIETQRLTQLV